MSDLVASPAVTIAPAIAVNPATAIPAFPDKLEKLPIKLFCCSFVSF